MDSRYPPPMGLGLRCLVDALDDDAREFFEERAGILEYEAGLPRQAAEGLAWAETQKYLLRRTIYK